MMYAKATLFALFAAKVTCLALPQVESPDVQDPTADLIAAYEDAIDVPVDTVVIPSAADAKPDLSAQAAAIADAVSGGIERRSLRRRNSFLGVSGFNGPDTYNDKTINAPKGDSTYMGVQTFPQDTTYDPNICAQACLAKSAYNRKQAVDGVQPRVCRYFIAYTVLKNGQDPLFTCTYYTQPWTAAYATNAGSTRNGIKYTNQDSNGYTLVETKDACVADITDGKSYETQGLAFRVLYQPYRDGDRSSAFTADHIRGQSPSYTGITQRLDWISARWPYGSDGLVTIGGYTFDSGVKSVLAQGYFVAPTSSSYTFSLSPGKDDNFARIWIGNKAYSQIAEANADANVAFDYYKIGSSELVSTIAYTFTKGQIYPMSFLWSNRGNQAQSFLKITDAAGNDVSLGYFVRPCNVATSFPLPSA